VKQRSRKPNLPQPQPLLFSAVELWFIRYQRGMQLDMRISEGGI
jgi:hypothetical protein